jgi:hypothetical protein
MTVSILQSNYIPWKGYFDIIAKSDVFVVYDEVQYTKNDWRNRNVILCQQLPTWLTIPVKQKNLNQLICDTKIASHSWNRKHLNSITLNYKKSSGFEYFKDELTSMYDFSSEYLSEVNVHFIKTVCRLMNIKTKIIDSRELNLQGDRNEKLIDACQKLSATHYLSGPAAKSYLNVDLFNQSGVQLKWMDYSNYPVYEQSSNVFTHQVSIIDLMLNVGNDSRSYINLM